MVQLIQQEIWVMKSEYWITLPQHQELTTIKKPCWAPLCSYSVQFRSSCAVFPRIQYVNRQKTPNHNRLNTNMNKIVINLDVDVDWDDERGGKNELMPFSQCSNIDILSYSQISLKAVLVVWRAALKWRISRHFFVLTGTAKEKKPSPSCLLSAARPCSLQKHSRKKVFLNHTFFKIFFW